MGSLLATTGEQRTRRSAVTTAAVVAVLLAVVAVFGFTAGGYLFQRTAPVAVAFAVLAVVGIWLARGLARPPRAYLVALAAFAALVIWTGLSILWSAGPDLSWVAFDVAAFYLLVMAACGLLPDGVVQLRLAAHGFVLVVAAVSMYAVLGKTAPDVVTHAHLFPRVSAPVGYWNVLGAMIAMAVPILLTLASRAAAPLWLRGLASSCLVLLFVTLFFTFSRGSFLALALALVVYFCLTTSRLSAFVSLTIPVVLAGAALFRVRGLSTLFTATTNDALRASQGHTLAAWFVAALVLAFLTQALVALGQRRWSPSQRQARVTGVVIIAALVLVPIGAGAVYFPAHGGLRDWVSSHYRTAMSGSGPTNDVNRLTSLGSSGRIPWYKEALRGFGDHPLIGSGAGTFQFTNYRYRDRTWVVRHSHSQWLNLLSELGIVGFTLFAATIIGLVMAAFRRLTRDRSDPNRSLLAACQAAFVVFVVHLSIDWDWDMAVITLSFLLLAGASAAYIRDRDKAERPGAVWSAAFRRTARSRVPRPPLWVRVAVTGLVAFGIVSWTLPYLSQRATTHGIDQLSREQAAKAVSSARRASSLDPLDVQPLLVLAKGQAALGDRAAARATMARAVRLQPANYEPYSEMGRLLLEQGAGKAQALPWLEKAHQLNPLDAATNRLLTTP